MIHADIILQGGTIITMNDDYTIIEDGSVVINDTRIIAVGERHTIDGQYSSDQIIDCRGKYIIPGLINAHTHVPMTLLRGMADDLRLDVWLMGYIMPAEREFVSPEFCQLGTTLACAEMIKGGVTAFADMYYFEADIAEATARAGLRALLCESILKFPTPDAATYEDSIALTRQFIEKWKGHPLITPTIAPHAPYSNTEETLQQSAALAKEFSLPLMIHIAETAREQEDSRSQYGKTVVPWVKDQGVLDVPIIAAHCVHIDEHEMRILKKAGGSVAHCPSANLKLASGIAPITRMLEIGVNVAIGTDGPASNNDLDMFEEMRLAALVAKVTPNNPTALPARQALQMATINGARALGLADVTGSIEVGKYADIAVIDANPTHNMPHFRFNPDAPYSQLVYAAKASDVQHTICHGKFLMKDRQLLTIDEKVLYEEAAKYADRVGDFLTQIEENPLSKLVAVAIDVERAESFEIQLKAELPNADIIEDLLSHSDVEVLRAVHYRQYDTYFLFEGKEQGRIRYREDDRIDAEGNVSSVRMRLTYTTTGKEQVFHDAVVLSHSQFIAPASHPLRFYQEYFQPKEQRELHKERRRWRVSYKDILFFVNVDRLIKPESSKMFIEIKSRTWSLSDAEVKAKMIAEMMEIVQIDASKIVRKDYLDFS